MASRQRTWALVLAAGDGTRLASLTTDANGRFAVDYSKVKQAVRDLTHELLTIEARGDYHAAQQMLETLGVIRPSVQKALDRMTHIPVDIEPKFVTANRLVPSTANQF